VFIDNLRLFIHVLAATVWVGGQIVLAGLVPTVREIDPDAPKKVARAFNRLAWPAYGVLVLSGIWNVFAVPLDALPHPDIELKVTFALLSGFGAFIHQTARGNTARLAVGGAMASLFAVASLWLGVVMPI
jgi:putative copper export protein